jgi:hypothetical protein
METDGLAPNTSPAAEADGQQGSLLDRATPLMRRRIRGLAGARDRLPRDRLAALCFGEAGSEC